MPQRILIASWLPEGLFEELRQRRPDYEWCDGRTPDGLTAHLPRTEIVYGVPTVAQLAEAPALRWLQIPYAGVSPELCAAARARNLSVTNLSGLYGSTIAEHALAL